MLARLSIESALRAQAAVDSAVGLKEANKKTAEAAAISSTTLAVPAALAPASEATCTDVTAAEGEHVEKKPIAAHPVMTAVCSALKKMIGWTLARPEMVAMGKGEPAAVSVQTVAVDATSTFERSSDKVSSHTRTRARCPSRHEHARGPCAGSTGNAQAQTACGRRRTHPWAVHASA